MIITVITLSSTNDCHTAEVSDQNFVDEVVEVEKGSRDCNA